MTQEDLKKILIENIPISSKGLKYSLEKLSHLLTPEKYMELISNYAINSFAPNARLTAYLSLTKLKDSKKLILPTLLGAIKTDRSPKVREQIFLELLSSKEYNQDQDIIHISKEIYEKRIIACH
jgi:hypothetical protein